MSFAHPALIHTRVELSGTQGIDLHCNRNHPDIAVTFSFQKLSIFLQEA